MGFEELDVRKRAARLSATLYQETRSLNDFAFRDQITRAGLSIPSNIAEGYERDSHAEKARFLTIAKGSAGELIAQIYIGMEANYLDRFTGKAWIQKLNDIARILGALIKHWKQDARH